MKETDDFRHVVKGRWQLPNSDLGWDRSRQAGAPPPAEEQRRRCTAGGCSPAGPAAPTLASSAPQPDISERRPQGSTVSLSRLGKRNSPRVRPNAPVERLRVKGAAEPARPRRQEPPSQSQPGQVSRAQHLIPTASWCAASSAKSLSSSPDISL